ncbi:MAG: hypothetical protein KAS66_05830 [Candidatus Omnitrophica bacterium]|nr:hypothetical protein [Candidatus Omnitrophota bacterium]
MRIFSKFKKTEAQHTVEYAVLMALIMAGIIIAGPYVIRSWNANLQGWDDSVVDSHQEPLLPNPEDIVIFPGCTAEIWNDLGCGFDIYDVCTGLNFSCGPQEMLRRQNYEPPGCQCSMDPPPSVYYLECEVDDSNHCCTPWVPDPPTIADCGINATPPCPDGKYRAFHVCDSGYTETACIADPICEFICTSPPFVGSPPDYDGICTNDDLYLPDDVMNTFVLHGECTDPRKCETQCGIGYFVFGAGVFMYCGPCGELGIERTGCPGTLLNHRGCGMKRFKPCCYAP